MSCRSGQAGPVGMHSQPCTQPRAAQPDRVPSRRHASPVLCLSQCLQQRCLASACHHGSHTPWHLHTASNHMLPCSAPAGQALQACTQQRRQLLHASKHASSMAQAARQCLPASATTHPAVRLVQCCVMSGCEGIHMKSPASLCYIMCTTGVHRTRTACSPHVQRAPPNHPCMPMAQPQPLHANGRCRHPVRRICLGTH